MTVPLLVQFALCPLVGISLLLMPAPYGRHYRPGWGPTMANRRAWRLMELPALGCIAVLVLSAPEGYDAVALVPLSLWMLHYSYRTFVFPALMRPSRHTFPVLLVGFAVAFNLLNGYNNAQALLGNAAADKPLWTAHFAAGAVLFVAGFVVHAHSDALIRALRGPGETAYRIPGGGLFRWVSSPQYLGEIVQWSGWAVMTWSWAGLAFALFTFCNLAPRALANQRWYRRTFADYPAGRKALLPGLF